MKITKLIQSSYDIPENTISVYSCTQLSDKGVAWVLSQLGQENLLESVLKDARRMAGDAIYSGSCVMNRYSLEKALGSRYVDKEWVRKAWVVDYTGVSYENLHEFQVDEGVLEVEVRWLEEESIKVDFIYNVEKEKYESTNSPHRYARISFSMPMPEHITSDGEKDFDALCERAAGPEELVYWHEMLDSENRARSKEGYRN
jgi:hypothetical protein